ncbi:hypothetical protein QBC40DRAFT_189235 [Triangularia verruculosa]|uniref:Uncharacterized protein n=1 Tax=Triangularia verruculosa TaxID=2587418 RepID=A0AAN6X5G1_9PEZI|nr:hypothetical protein QBC40DRAFT_189235 [Triangularia verruculosa]
MSGIEVVGLVLGAFPLIIEGGKLLRSYLEKTEFWLKFASRFPAMVASIEDEMVLFRQNLELVLRPLALDTDTEAKLLDDSRLTEWEDPILQSLLRSRIGHDKFPWFMEKLCRMICLPRVGTVDYALLRLAVSFTNKRDLVKEVTHINMQISRFLEADLRIAQATILAPAIMNKRKRKASETAAGSLVDLQSEAAILYQLFRPEKWHCECQKLYPCGITTTWSEDRLKRTRRSGRIRLLLGSDGVSDSPVEVDIEVGARRTSFTVQETRCKSESSTNVTAKLTTQIHLGSDSKWHVKAVEAKTTALVALSTFQDAIRPLKMGSWSSSPFPKPTKLASSDSSKRHVHFEHFEAPQMPGFAVETEVTIGCNLFETPALALGKLKSNIHHQDKTIILSPKPPTPSKGASSPVQYTRTLTKMYQSTHSLDERIHVGVQLAYSILGLGTSPWIPQGWNDTDVNLVEGSFSKLLYFQHTSIRSALARDTICDKGCNTGLRTVVQLQ